MRPISPSVSAESDQAEEEELVNKHPNSSLLYFSFRLVSQWMFHEVTSVKVNYVSMRLPLEC